MSKKDIIDDDGNIIAPPPADHPVRAIVWLLEYGRTRGFRIGPRIQVGDTIVECADLRLIAKEYGGEPKPSDLEPGSPMAVLLAGDE